ESSFLANLLEQPARHAAAQDGVHHAVGKATVIPRLESPRPQHEVHLLPGFFRQHDARRSVRDRGRCRHRWFASITTRVRLAVLTQRPAFRTGTLEAPDDGGDKGVVVDRAGGGHNEGSRMVRVLIVPYDIVALRRLD